MTYNGVNVVQDFEAGAIVGLGAPYYIPLGKNATGVRGAVVLGESADDALSNYLNATNRPVEVRDRIRGGTLYFRDGVVAHDEKTLASVRTLESMIRMRNDAPLLVLRTPAREGSVIVPAKEVKGLVKLL